MPVMFRPWHSTLQYHMCCTLGEIADLKRLPDGALLGSYILCDVAEMQRGS